MRWNPEIPGHRADNGGVVTPVVKPNPAPLWGVCDQSCDHRGAIIWAVSEYRIITAEVEISTLQPHQEDKTRCDECVQGYMARIDTCGPVLVYQEGSARVLVNGHHRREAAKRLGRSEIRAIVEFRPVFDALTYPDQRTPGGCGHPGAPGAGSG